MNEKSFFFYIDNHGFGIGFLYHAVLCNICTSPQNDAHRKLRIESIPLNTKWFHQNRKRRNRSETSCECNLHNSNMKSMKLHWMCMVKAFRIFVCERKVCAIRCIPNMHSMHPIFSVQNNIQYAEYRMDMYVRSHRFSIYIFSVANYPFAWNRIKCTWGTKPNQTRLNDSFQCIFTSHLLLSYVHIAISI